ncbi:Histone-arginine methyltransferase CARM1 [Halotydeus destructor]|nr:Histone-arginine methyltransferase CARM1 [Halotydeus destructor]
MAAIFRNVTLGTLDETTGKFEQKVPNVLTVQLLDEQENLLIRFRDNDVSPPLTNLSLELYKDSETSRFGQKSYIIRDDNTGSTSVLSFERESDVIKFAELIKKFKQGDRESVFALRTEEASASQYFQFYGYLSQQQNMMQDYIRTSTYQRAIISNVEDFRDKVVLDVGAGSGILSFFAVQAGAKKVYAVEASSMAKHAEHLVFSNKLSSKITVIPGKIEEVNIPEPVDVIISEPMGYMLFNERMLETYLHGKKWLKPNGKMFPTRGDLHVAPFNDAALYMEQLNKANFWCQESFHGVDLTSLRSAAIKEYFRQPIVDTFDVRICMAKSHRFTVDFLTAHENDLHRMDIPFSFTMLQSGEVHGLAFWFDVAFLGSQQSVWLSTAPTQPLTHWYQVRCLVDTPVFVHKGQVLTGKVVLVSNKRQSYDVEMELHSESSGQRISNVLDLKNPYFRYTGQAPSIPPGTHETSPSEQYWATVDTTQHVPVGNNIPLVNGNMNGAHSSMVDLSGQSQGIHYAMGNQQMSGSCLTSPVNRTSPHPRINSTPVAVPVSSIGGGVAPAIYNSALGVLSNSANFPVSNNLMIGDYATPGNLVLPPGQQQVYR